MSNQWNGKGLPPVGTKCEWLQGSSHQWERIEILAHNGLETWIRQESGRGLIVGNIANLRPLRTPEQIAAEERVKAIDVLMADTDFILDRTCAQAVIAAGYRKVEGSDRKGEALQVAVRALKRLEAEPGCGCPTPCQCYGPEWSRAEIEGRMGEAEEALRKIEQIQGGVA